MKNLTEVFVFAILLFAGGYLNAQSVRSLNNKGVDLYKEGKFADSEVNFKKGNLKEPKNFETSFNLGDAYFKQERYDDAIKSYRSALEESENPDQKANVYHNIGNSLLKDKKIKESIEAYKNSLKLNPNDEDTKYNLSYALSLLKNQQNQQQNKNNKNNKNDKNNKDQNKNQNQNKNQDKKKNENQNNNEQNKPQQNQAAKQDNLKQEKNKISKEEADRILDALKNNEVDLQKKLRKKSGSVVKTDKDW
jgi:Ca-activated chloride channel family protein